MTSASRDLARLAREFERIADKIRDLENLGTLVIVREDHGAPLAFELQDTRDGIGIALAGRQVVGVFLIEGGQLGMQVLCADGGRERCVDGGTHKNVSYFALI